MGHRRCISATRSAEATRPTSPEHIRRRHPLLSRTSPPCKQAPWALPRAKGAGMEISERRRHRDPRRRCGRKPLYGEQIRSKEQSVDFNVPNTSVVLADMDDVHRTRDPRCRRRTCVLRPASRECPHRLDNDGIPTRGMGRPALGVADDGRQSRMACDMGYRSRWRPRRHQSRHGGDSEHGPTRAWAPQRLAERVRDRRELSRRYSWMDRFGADEQRAA